jgi:proteasome lid subunit RPN8/RPN11
VIALAPSHVDAIRDHGRRAYPEECCGILLGTIGDDGPRVASLIAIDNVHEQERRRRYLIAPRDYLAAEREAKARGLVVLGIYHSHPDHSAEPSAHDRELAWPNLHYLILAVAKGAPGELTSWVLSEDRTTMRPERLAVVEPPRPPTTPTDRGA